MFQSSQADFTFISSCHQCMALYALLWSFSDCSIHWYIPNKNQQTSWHRKNLPSFTCRYVGRQGVFMWL